MNATPFTVVSRFAVIIAGLITSALLLTAGCAITPSIKTNYDPGIDFNQYRTFGFFEKLGTDKAQYSTLITGYLKAAVRRELTAKGMTESENPELLVNFHTNAETKTQVRSNPAPTYRYYSYRGFYTDPMLYDQRIETIEYKVGTLNIDLVDAEHKRLVWEGIAEGRLTNKALENPQTAINATVTGILSRFPPKGGGSE